MPEANCSLSFLPPNCTVIPSETSNLPPFQLNNFMGCVCRVESRFIGMKWGIFKYKPNLFIFIRALYTFIEYFFDLGFNNESECSLTKDILKIKIRN